MKELDLPRDDDSLHFVVASGAIRNPRGRRRLRLFSSETDLAENVMQTCDQMSRTGPASTAKMFAHLQTMAKHYNCAVLLQVQRSFMVALGTGLLGTAFFAAAIWSAMRQDSFRTTTVPLIAGAIVQVISGLNFWLYLRAGDQFSKFHDCIERMTRYLLAASLSEGMADDSMRTKTQSDVVQEMIRADLWSVAANAEARRAPCSAAPSGLAEDGNRRTDAVA